MLTSPNPLLQPANGVPHHILGYKCTTTPVGMYFRYRIGPLDAIAVIYCGKANQLVRICSLECSLAPIFCSNLLMGCHTTSWAITTQQHPLACISDIASVHWMLLMSSNATKPTKYSPPTYLNAH